MKRLILFLAIGSILPAGTALLAGGHGQGGQGPGKKRVLPPPAQEDWQAPPGPASPRRHMREQRPQRPAPAFSGPDRRSPASGRSAPRPFRPFRMLREPRERSLLRLPETKPDGLRLEQRLFSPRTFSGAQVRGHMAVVASAPWLKTALRLNRSETRVDHYYWHRGDGFDYCHYYDPWGYHWYGWYFSSHYFWTRYYAGRWWWYDMDGDRWCFWWHGGWWWHDPFHLGVVYAYRNGIYVEFDEP